MMINIHEYLLSKNKVQRIIHATDETLYRVVRDEINKLGKNADLNHIDVSKVKNFFYGLDMDDNKPDNLTGLFENTDFYGDISEWDMSNAENTTSMFYGLKKFNCDISNWNVENIKKCNFMFRDCISFRIDLSKWNMKNIKTDINNCGMFDHCPMFHHRKLQPQFPNIEDEL